MSSLGNGKRNSDADGLWSGFWLGVNEYLCNATRERLLASMEQANPAMTPRQKEKLKDLMDRCFRQIYSGERLQGLQNLRACFILGLQGCSNPEGEEFFESLIELLPAEPLMNVRSPEEIETFSLPQIDSRLRETFGITTSEPFALPAVKRRALLNELYDRLVVKKIGIICPITWEELFDPVTAKVKDDVVVLFEEKLAVTDEPLVERRLFKVLVDRNMQLLPGRRRRLTVVPTELTIMTPSGICLSSETEELTEFRARFHSSSQLELDSGGQSLQQRSTSGLALTRDSPSHVPFSIGKQQVKHLRSGSCIAAKDESLADAKCGTSATGVIQTFNSQVDAVATSGMLVSSEIFEDFSEIDWLCRSDKNFKTSFANEGEAFDRNLLVFRSIRDPGKAESTMKQFFKGFQFAASSIAEAVYEGYASLKLYFGSRDRNDLTSRQEGENTDACGSAVSINCIGEMTECDTTAMNDPHASKTNGSRRRVKNKVRRKKKTGEATDAQPPHAAINDSTTKGRVAHQKTSKQKSSDFLQKSNTGELKKTNLYEHHNGGHNFLRQNNASLISATEKLTDCSLPTYVEGEPIVEPNSEKVPRRKRTVGKRKSVTAATKAIENETDGLQIKCLTELNVSQSTRTSTTAPSACSGENTDNSRSTSHEFVSKLASSSSDVNHESSMAVSSPNALCADPNFCIASSCDYPADGTHSSDSLFYCHFYSGSSLDIWFTVGKATNPITRQYVLSEGICRLSETLVSAVKDKP